MGIQISSLINHLVASVLSTKNDGISRVWHDRIRKIAELSRKNDGINKIKELSTTNDGIKKIIESSENDRISNLPDCVLSHILSFLPTSDSVLTSLLSSRWKNVWKYVTTLSFDSNIPPFNPVHDRDRNFHESVIDSRFSTFVESVLLSYDKTNLHNFHLRFLQVSNLYDVNKWFDWAIMRGVRSLDFCYGESNRHPPAIELPSCILNCKTLEEIKLFNVVVVAHNSCLPNLKAMYLTMVRFQDDDFFTQLISSCRSLESLVISVSLVTTKVSILSCTLRDLRITLIPEHPELEIDAPALEYLLLVVSTDVNCQIKKLSSLKEAVIIINPRSDTIVMRPCVVNVLQAICNVKILNLIIITHVHDTCSELPNIPCGGFPIFHKLTVLNLTAYCYRWALLFLNNSYKLVHLNILNNSLDFEGDHHEFCWKNPRVVPACLISSLTSMTIDGFTNYNTEQAMAKYIIGKAKIMRRLNISCNETPAERNYRLKVLGNEYPIKKLRRKIFKLPRGSEECEVEVRVERFKQRKWFY